MLLKRTASVFVTDPRHEEILRRFELNPQSDLALALMEAVLDPQKIFDIASELQRSVFREACVEILIARGGTEATRAIAKLLRYEPEIETFERCVTLLKEQASDVADELITVITVRRLLHVRRINPRARLLELVQEPVLDTQSVKRAIQIAPLPALRSAALQVLLTRSEESVTEMVSEILIKEPSELVIEDVLAFASEADASRLATFGLALLLNRPSLSKSACDSLVSIVAKSNRAEHHEGLRAFALSEESVKGERVRVAVLQLDPKNELDLQALVSILTDRRRAYTVRHIAAKRLLQGPRSRAFDAARETLAELHSGGDTNSLVLLLDLSVSMLTSEREELLLKAVIHWIKSPSASAILNARLLSVIEPLDYAPWLGEPVGSHLRALIESGRLQPDAYALFQKLVMILPIPAFQRSFQRAGFKLPYNYHRHFPRLLDRLSIP